MEIIQKIKTFFREVWVEMKRVSWLTRKEVFRHTMVVLGITIAVAAFLGALDFLFSEIIKRLVF